MKVTVPPPVGEFCLVEGRRLWVDWAGAGGPAVVFVPGAGGFGLDLLLPHRLVAELTTSVIYDRAGTGWSDDTDLPRPLDEVVDELRAVLRAIGTEPPYLLAGHSLGALYVRRYTQRFPGEVAGLLLVEPAHEDWDSFMPDELKLANQPAATKMPELPPDFLSQYRAAFDDLFSAFPPSVRDPLIARHFDPDRLANGFREGANVLSVFEELRCADRTPAVPLIILSGTDVDATQTLLASPERIHAQIEGSQRLYDTLTAATPLGVHRTLPDASHLSLPLRRPDAISRAVHDLLDQPTTPPPRVTDDGLR